MSHWLEQVAEDMISIIQAIQFQRKTGLLAVRRGEGTSSEEGKLVFVDGHVTEASVGRRTGAEALNWISSWEHCLFSFIPPESAGNNFARAPTLPAHPPSARETPPLGLMPPLNKPVGLSSGVERITAQPRSREQAVPYRLREPNVAGVLLDRSGLSRVHRHLFFLVDGQRSIAMLVHVTGRSLDEVYRLLCDLADQNIISIPGR